MTRIRTALASNTTAMPLLEPGQLVPDVKLPDQDGRERSPREFAGRSLVIFFYCKDGSAQCTAQAAGFRDAAKALEARGVAVVGISAESQRSHSTFAAKQRLNYPILADEPAAGQTPAASGAFGVWQEKSMYGRKYMGIVRTTFLIGPDGRVQRRWDKVSVPGHVDEVVAAVSGGAANAASGAPSSTKKSAKAAARKAPVREVPVPKAASARGGKAKSAKAAPRAKKAAKASKAGARRSSAPASRTSRGARTRASARPR